MDYGIGGGGFTYLRSSVDERSGGGRGRQFLGSYEEHGGKESGNAQMVEFVHESAATTKPTRQGAAIGLGSGRTGVI